MQDEIERWKKPPFDEQTKAEIERLEKENPDELRDCFSHKLAFGTGGIRGLMGVGIARLNAYTIQVATQGLANYIQKNGTKKNPSVFISHDSRNRSREFAVAAAQVLAGNGIKAILTKELRPTPFVSFGCRANDCQAGIMITASHNPPEYNGYKVYWEDGAQVTAPHDAGIVEEVGKLTIDDVKVAEETDPLITLAPDSLDQEYLKAIRPQALHEKENQTHGKDLTIVYTPLHGCGGTLTPRALADWGFTTVVPVKEQIAPDGSFPTTKTPNPEDHAALTLGVETLKRENGDILLATDPDADRLACVVNHNGEIRYLTGNQTAAIILEHRLRTLKDQKKLPQNGAVVSTIVSTRLLEFISNSYHMDYFDVLTGFKYIGGKIREWETSSNHYDFLFGAEESIGYLIGTHSRDKDAIVSACVLSEIALDAKRQNRTLIDCLTAIYEKYGVFYEMQKVIAFPPSANTMDAMNEQVDTLRKEGLQKLGSYSVMETTDYAGENTGLPKSNVLRHKFNNNATLLIRPSGTEPKIKIYGQIQGAKNSSIEHTSQVLEATISEMAELIAKRLS